MSTPFPTRPDAVVVDVWSDVMCPFCYIGDALLAQAAEKFEQPVEIRYHSYQLMPHLPHGEAADLNELLAREKGMSREQAQSMNAQVSARAASVGLDFHTDQAIATNTRTAHRLTHFAAEHGKQHALVDRLFRAYFSDGLHTGDREVLADLAAEVGLDRDAALAVIDSDAHSDAVDTDIALARQIGISGVPFFVFDGKYAVSGAQPVEAFTQALTTAWQDHVG
ncbi:DsbA family oxidoreductase [Nocardioides massiliensis]|uniref:DsbA family dithiol-disulfide isomerase n=1 Tax=Nocardioides massiliensis TaxID=1325935 RepID=A0ABT9NQ05_9ACTN|nr:DsbA family oxidoreductase [Nocardioides massiliensis]MDP9822135.1 putative DsbA family dithiol-disulfide isomerase [Nocardioides massiliensis]